jgi:signal transduction histidine kinase
VGAKLLTLVYRAPTPEHADLARAALQDLRDVVSRPGETDQLLEYLVGDWRSECVQRLGAAGIELEWLQPPSLDRLRLSPTQGMNLGRILREAVSNVIRHAHATQVRVEFQWADGVLHLHVADNGQADTVTLQRVGRGTRNMQSRAQAMGGTFARTAHSPAGCHVHVSLPLIPTP